MSIESELAPNPDALLVRLRGMSDAELDAERQAQEAKAGDLSQASHVPIELVEISAEQMRRKLIADGRMTPAGKPIIAGSTMEGPIANLDPAAAYEQGRMDGTAERDIRSN